MNTIEQQLWDYIDGNLDETQAKAIEQRIESNVEIKAQYEEFLNLNLAFDQLELDEPSMSFTRNVMESVALEPAPVALKTKVNSAIVYSIGGFFLLSLSAILGFVLYQADISFKNFGFGTTFNFNIDQYFTPTLLYAFLFADLVIGLVFLDYFLRKKIMPKH